MCFIRRVTKFCSPSLYPRMIKRNATSSDSSVLRLIMEASKDKVTFFANAHDATDYFQSTFCTNISQSVGIKNFIKKYPDAVYTTARISGEDFMVIIIY